jgi:hypothetical protein
MGGLSAITCNILLYIVFNSRRYDPQKHTSHCRPRGVSSLISGKSEIIHLSVFGSYRMPEVAAVCASLRLLDSFLPLRTSYYLVDCNLVSQPNIYGFGIREHHFESPVALLVNNDGSNDKSDFDSIRIQIYHKYAYACSIFLPINLTMRRSRVVSCKMPLETIHVI